MVNPIIPTCDQKKANMNNPTLEIACEKLREYLENWYMDRVEEYFSTDEGRGILPEELTIARQSFFREYPEYAPFEFDIYTTFDTGASICGGGCCSPLSADGKEHKTVRGVKVGPMNWAELTALGIKEVKI